MEYVIIGVAVLAAAWMFRNALKDLFGIFGVFRQLGVRLFRLVTPGRAKELGKRHRSEAVQNLLEIQRSGDLTGYASALGGITGDSFAEYIHAGVTDVGERHGKAQPGDPRAQIVHAAYLLDAANEARGKASADRTETSALQSFDELNQTARALTEQVLEQLSTDLSLAEQPEHAMAAYQLLIRSIRGTDDTARALSAFDSALALAPDRLDVQVPMLNLVSERWTGEPSGPLRLLATTQRASGHHAGVVPAAHIEHWMDLDGNVSNTYFEQPAVLEALDAAYQALPQRIDSSDWLPQHQQALALNAFALCYSLAGKKSLARKVFGRIGDRYTSFPWQYVGKDPQVAFLKVKDSNL